MKKLTLIASILLLAVFSLKAQPRQGMVKYDKQQVPCFISEYPYPQSTTEDAIKDKFKTMGVKGNDRKGFIEYNNVVLPELGATPVDAKFRVEKQDKNTSTVYMIVSAAGTGQNVAGSSNIMNYAAGSTNFLSGLTTTTSDYSLEQEIKKQDDEVKKAEKKSSNLVEDGNDMQKRLQKLQNDIAENQKKQADQVVEVQKQRDLLLQAQSRRRVKQ